MKLSSDTLNVLKNFANINKGILFKKGKTLKTVSSHKNILAEVNIAEEIPNDFGIYDLTNFLSVVSAHKDSPSFEIGEKRMFIVSKVGGKENKLTFGFCEPTMIVLPPEKAISMPDPEISFELTSEDFDWVLKIASILSSPHIAIESDGKKVFVVTLNLQDDSAHTDSLEVCSGNGDKYKMIFKTENISKVMPGSYEVKISSKGIAHFKNKTLPLQYWISIESGSKFEKSK